MSEPTVWAIRFDDGMYVTTEGSAGPKYVYRCVSLDDARLFPSVRAAFRFALENAHKDWIATVDALVEVKPKTSNSIVRAIT